MSQTEIENLYLDLIDCSREGRSHRWPAVVRVPYTDTYAPTIVTRLFCLSVHTCALWITSCANRSLVDSIFLLSVDVTN